MKPRHARRSPRKPAPKCSFCGRCADQVRLLLASRIKGAFICDVCILLAMHGLVDKCTAAPCLPEAT